MATRQDAGRKLAKAVADKVEGRRRQSDCVSKGRRFGVGKRREVPMLPSVNSVRQLTTSQILGPPRHCPSADPQVETGVRSGMGQAI
jgi:hypothetical protein